MKRVVLSLGLPVLLAACSTGGGRADFDLKQIPGATVFESERDFASTVINGRYRLLNNVWNKGATTGRYRQKIFVLKNGFLTPRHSIANLELGDEVQRGTGTTVVRNYAVKVE
jgi:hypothetical protein